MIHTKNRITLSLTLAVGFIVMLMTGCGNEQKAKGQFSIYGAWTATKSVYPGGLEHDYSVKQGAPMVIFGSDDTYCGSHITMSPGGTVVVPTDTGSYSLIYKGNGEWLFLLDGSKCPLTVINDSIITFQHYGVVRTLARMSQLPTERVDEIHRFVYDSLSDTTQYQSNRYVISTAERQLKTTNNALVYSIIAIVLVLGLIAAYAMKISHRKREVENRLRQLTEEQQNRPQQVRDAMKSVEDDFVRSEFYTSIHRRLASGTTFKAAEWKEIEDQLKRVYPGFANNLNALCRMSDTEYQVCLLTKLNAAPGEIATVLCKDVSSVSSIRSRLYQKVFDRKGGAKDWDKFIHSL